VVISSSVRLIEKDFPMPFVDTNDDVFLGERSFATRQEALGNYEILPYTSDLFDSDGSRVVASALGEFPAARRSAGSDERSPHHVVERSAYGASDCAVFI